MLLKPTTKQKAIKIASKARKPKHPRYRCTCATHGACAVCKR